MIYREMSISVNGNTIASDDAQKRKQIQQQLILIFHACRCQKHFEINGMTPCSSPHCAMMRNVLSHMSMCNRDKQCPFSHCSTSKRILSHWKRCGKFTCLICAPIKQSSKSKTTFESTDQDVQHVINNEITMNQDKKSIDKSSDYKSEINDNKMKDKKTLDKDIRSRLINRIVETILPVKDCGKAYKDERMINIINHAKKIENDSYMKSNSIDEYYRLLAENCFIIHKKLCISQKNSENCVNYPEIISKPSTILADNSTNDNDSDLFSISNKGCSDTDHLNHFEKILQNEYERQRKLLLSYDVKDDSKMKEIKKEPKVEIKQEIQTVPEVEEPKKQDSSLKTWSKEELITAFKVFFDYVKNNKAAQLFLNQVDIKNYNSGELSKINSKPITLSSISQKLEDGEYDDPWAIVDELNLLIKNICIYTKKKGKSKKDFVQSMNEIQVQIDEIMVTLGFCCGRVEVYQPLTLLCCTANVCTINKDSVYYVYQNETSDDKVPGMSVESYLCCEKCYSDSSSKVTFIAESNELLLVKKELLVKKKNNVEIHEEFVFCGECKRKWHKVCACHIDEIWPAFYCKNCLQKVPKLVLKENKYTAKRLLPSVLSNFLEKRVNDYLKKNEITTDNVIIRVLSSVKKVTEVKPGIKSFFGDAETSFPYRSKAIFAFQEYQGREVCFFGLHVQEYGSDCPEPNKRRVYVAYLDSVKFFEPSKHRTKVYYEILVGYLDYVKKLGYVMAHIWACPPSEGDDYIFHIHPPDQRIPKPKRLQEWYTKMLDKGIQELVIDDYKDVYKDAHLSEIKSVVEIPYFEGDFWPNAFEDILKEFEENNRKAKETVHQEDEDNETLDTSYEISNDNIGNKKPKKRKQKKTTSIAATSKRKKCHDPADVVNELFKKVLEIMEKHKDNFFIIRLQKNVCNLKEICDPDPSVESELMDGRENFLQMARVKHLEFSNLRRSLFSTLVMCYELHNEMKQSFCYTCNACNAQIETRYHCAQCEEYDLCEKCYLTNKHIHPLELIKSVADGEHDSSTFKSDDNCEETYRTRIDRLVKNFEHASSCRDANCKMPNCKVFKNWFMYHNKSCKDGVKCSQCKWILKLSAYHAKFCTDLKCIITYCQQIKQKLKKQENKLRYSQKQILRRRTAQMRCNSNVSNNPPSASAQDCANTGGTTVGQMQYVQSSGPQSNSSNNNTNLDYIAPGKINPSVSNQSFNLKPNYIHQSNSNVSLSISPNVNDMANFQCAMYSNGNYPPMINQAYSTQHTEMMMMVEKMYATFTSQPDGNLKFKEWLKNNPGYTAAYRTLISRHIPPMPTTHQMYSSNTMPPQNNILHQRMHNITSAPSNQSQIPFYVSNPSMNQQINQNYIQEMNNHIVTNNKPMSGIVPNQISLPMNRISIPNHNMNNYSPSTGKPFLMNYIPNVQNHQSSPANIRPIGNYSQISNGANINHQGSQRVYSKMIAPQKGLPQPTSLHYQPSNPNDSQLFRSIHQNYFN